MEAPRQRATQARVADSRQRAAATLRNAIEDLEVLIDQNRRIAARHPDHKSAELRALEGEAELTKLREDLARFEGSEHN